MNVRSSPQTAVFVSGSLMRHVAVMTGTGAIGLMAIFVVDLLSLLYVSWLGRPEATAGVGFATIVLTDATRAISAGGWATAQADLIAQGARLLTSAEPFA